MSEEWDYESGARKIKTREEAERWVKEIGPISRRRALEDRLGEEFPEYAAWLKRRVDRALELAERMLPAEEVERIMTEEGFRDENWEPERWRREHAKEKPDEH